MTFWTIMIITILSGPMEGSVTYVPYASKDDCEAATNEVSATFNEAFDHKFECEQTATPSSSPTPKRNPIYGDQ